MLYYQRTFLVIVCRYFPNFAEGLWSLITVMNASDWPAPLLPAYQYNRTYFFFFLVFLAVTSWAAMYVISGLVFVFFK